VKGIIISLTLFATLSPAAQACRGQCKGGGIGYLCGEKVYLADTYKKISAMDQQRLTLLSQKVLLEGAFYAHDHLYPQQAKKLREASEYIRFKPAHDVAIAGDDQIKSIPRGCQKIAIGNQDIESGIVEYNQDYYQRLSYVDQAYFKFHEAYIQYYHGINDTTIVRSSVADTLIKTFSYLGSIAYKFSGMLDGFSEGIGMECEDSTYKKTHDSFLLRQSPEYLSCMQKSYKLMLQRLGKSDYAIDKEIRGLDLMHGNWTLDQWIRKEVRDRQDELQKNLGAYCPKGPIHFGPYRGSGPAVESLFCQYNILDILAD